MRSIRRSNLRELFGTRVCPTRERHDGVEKERIQEATPIALTADERHREAPLLRVVGLWATGSPLPGQPPQPIYMDTIRLCAATRTARAVIRRALVGTSQYRGTKGCLVLARRTMAGRQERAMYLARFSYDLLPINRHSAIDFIHREVEAARSEGLTARLLLPLTRGHGGVALQFEVELTKLDQLDQFRNRGIGSSDETGGWVDAFSEILFAPPGGGNPGADRTPR